MRWINISTLAVAAISPAPGQAFVPTLRKKAVHSNSNLYMAIAKNGAEKAQVKSSDFQVVDPL
jgi:hypothetical protein